MIIDPASFLPGDISVDRVIDTRSVATLESSPFFSRLIVINQVVEDQAVAIINSGSKVGHVAGDDVSIDFTIAACHSPSHAIVFERLRGVFGNDVPINQAVAVVYTATMNIEIMGTAYYFVVPDMIMGYRGQGAVALDSRPSC